MYKLTFTLKQHTPIIHFQHEQEGATLRASEVKPKLDRFIKRRLKLTTFEILNKKRVEMPKKEFNNWFQNKETCSLNYSVRVSNSNINWQNQVTIIPPNVDTAIKRDDSSLTIISHYIDLLKKIEEHIVEFFILNSFGKRQSKGFGCFYVNSTTQDSFEHLDRRIFVYDRHDFVNEGLNFYEITSRAWRTLKSGSNWPYKKSRLFKYMFSNAMRWDKRWFKVALYDLINDPTNNNAEFKYNLLVTKNNPLDSSDAEYNETNGGYYDYDDNPDCEDEYCFGRAFLGLAEHYEFRTVKKDRIYQFKVKSESIERFKSPVVFKVFNNNIFAIVENIPEEIKDVEFTFDLIVKDPITKKQIDEIRDFIYLPTPRKFSLENFLDNHFSFVGFKKN